MKAEVRWISQSCHSWPLHERESKAI